MNTSAPTPPSSGSGSVCPRCHRAIPIGALGGACPACLLAAGFLSETAAPAPGHDEPPPLIAELAPEFPSLELLELLGRGGMGAVYKARQRDLDRFVALKILRAGLDADPTFAARFADEARALARLNHPGIVTLHEFGRTPAGRYFIVMEFVDGMNLRQLLAAGRIAPREALAIVPPLCDALQYAHDRGLVHRDIKPDNILIDRLGRVKIADFGLARLASFPSEPAGEIVGTPAYMAPEQHTRPASVDHRADIYALGVVLYQMLTGELPAPGELQPPSRRVQIDVRLDEIVLRALETDPALRYAAADKFKTELETVAASAPVVAPVVVNRGRPSPWLGFLLLFGALGALLLATAGRLPARVASHFDGEGRADGWTSRTAYLVTAAAVPLALGALFASLPLIFRKLPARHINLPHRDYWLSPERKSATIATLGRWMAAPACMLVVFFAELHLATLFANQMEPPRLSGGLLLSATIGLLIALMAWVAGFVLRFSDPKAGPAGLRRQSLAFVAACALSLLLPALLFADAWRRLPEKPGRREEAPPSSPITVMVRGEVARPGLYPLRPDATLIDAVAAAGGWASRGDQSAILVTPPGSGRPEVHDLGAILHGEAINPGIPAGATIFVPARNR